MSASNRQALFSAANLDQSSWKQVKGRNWFPDSRIGAENQILNEFYKHNAWDRGHLTRRTAVTWGNTHQARRASNDSCSYANASLQHENFNQDEWRVPERFVSSFDKAKDGKISVFTGPVFTSFDRHYRRPGVQGMARIPSGFWKIVAYVDRESSHLACQAYLMYQDAGFRADKRGQDEIKLRNYQVTTTEVERLTGLEFPDELFNFNPLHFFSLNEVDDDRTNLGPEAFVVPEHWDPQKCPDAVHGVIFSREDIKTHPEAFALRARTLTDSDFTDHLDRGGCSAVSGSSAEPSNLITYKIVSDRNGKLKRGARTACNFWNSFVLPSSSVVIRLGTFFHFGNTIAQAWA